MQHALVKVNKINIKEGLPLLEMGVALHTGEVVVGNIGSDIRAKYGVVGSNVNLTSRIESMSVGGQVLISDDTRRALGDMPRLGQELRFRPKGFDREIVAWEMLGLGGDHALELPGSSDLLAPIDPPLPLRFWRMHGKVVADIAHDGHLVQASATEGILRTNEAIDPFSEIKIVLAEQLPDSPQEDIWAKAGQTSEEGTRIRFSKAMVSIMPL